MLVALAYFLIDRGACGRMLVWRTQFIRRIKELLLHSGGGGSTRMLLGRGVTQDLVKGGSKIFS
jgi:hypothetical protein